MVNGIIKTIDIEGINTLINLFGNFDENIELIKSEYNVNIISRDTDMKLIGDEESVDKAYEVILLLKKLIDKGELLDRNSVRYCIELVKEGKTDEVLDITNIVAVTSRGKQIKCKSIGQKKYVDAIKNNSITLCVGPAGTGKTYLAVALAVMAYKNKEVEKIILTRPAVEAGERLGFLPGDLQEKVDPYLRPLYDALQEMFGIDNYARLIEKNVIEIAPLAYMRGRTLSSAFIILDEAQNTTMGQMKMFLTRLGEGSRMVVSGDITQVDLPNSVFSGLKHAIGVLEDIKGIEIVNLSYKDVIRHELVQSIIKAYEKHERSE